MKNFTLVLILLVAVITCQAQVPSDCTIPPELATVYKSDIKNLALQRMYQLQTPDTALVSIPESYQDTIAEGLAAIFNAISLPERDTVFNLYCIHAYPYLGAYLDIMIYVDTSYLWTQAWQNLNSITGNAYIDSLVVKYNLTVKDFYQGSWTYALLGTDLGLNNYSLIDSFAQEQGVIGGGINFFISADEGFDIFYEKIGDDRYYIFDIGWGDCIAGCINHKRWEFKVSADCFVEYLGYTTLIFGADSVPEPTSPCNSFPIGIEYIPGENYKIFPNPTNGILKIEGIKGYFEVFDSYGRLVKITKSNTIDISDTARGIYLLKATDELGRVYSSKVLKE